MNLSTHLKEALRVTPEPSPWPRMVVCAISTILPILVGVYNDQLLFSIFGALTGFLLVLNDHQGTLGHRLWVLTLTFLILVGGLLLGTALSDHKFLLVLTIGLWAYWLGLMAGRGAEFERAILFGAFQLLAGAYSVSSGASLPLILVYVFCGYLTIVALLSLVVLLRGHNPLAYARVRASMREALTLEKSRHRYAFAFLITVYLGVAIVEYFKLNHGYWIIGTTFLILRPDSTQSLYRIFQRFLGTLVGVLAAEVFVFSVHSLGWAIAILAVVSFLAPWALKRSYWLGTAVVSLMILILLDLPVLQHGDFLTPIVRLQATGIGCLLGLIGVICANPRVLLRKLLR